VVGDVLAHLDASWIPAAYLALTVPLACGSLAHLFQGSAALVPFVCQLTVDRGCRKDIWIVRIMRQAHCRLSESPLVKITM
jgi:hypothetical protein